MRTFRILGWGILAAMVSVAAPDSRAEQRLAGTYRCASVQVEAKSQQCTFPPLVLNDDGSYQIWGEQGTYTVLGKYVVLSESRKRGPGRIKKAEIVFEYFHKGKKHVITFRRVHTPPPGSAVI